MQVSEDFYLDCMQEYNNLIAKGELKTLYPNMRGNWSADLKDFVAIKMVEKNNIKKEQIQEPKKQEEPKVIWK